MAKARAALASVFGFSAFRPARRRSSRATLDGKDVLAVMPTGSGKSLCFQLPAIVREGLTLVVSPLIALMRDQVAQLRELGVEAASLNSSSDADERRRVARGLRDRSLRLLYVAPERLLRDDVLAALSEVADRSVSPSTRPIASRNGATTSGRNICACARSPRRSAASRRSP